MHAKVLAGCVLGLVLAAPQSALAQYGRYRGGVVWGPDGPLYDTRSPEWRMSGGNIFVYQGLMQQKLLLQQQKLMMRQQQMARQMKQAARNVGADDQPAITAQPARRRRKATSGTGSKRTGPASEKKPSASDAASKPSGKPPSATETPPVAPTPN